MSNSDVPSLDAMLAMVTDRINDEDTIAYIKEK